MKAITLIRGTGLTTAEIAKAIGCTTHAIRYYERGERFPTRKQFSAINDLALSRGLRLSAADFEVEPNEPKEARDVA